LPVIRSDPDRPVSAASARRGTRGKTKLDPEQCDPLLNQLSHKFFTEAVTSGQQYKCRHRETALAKASKPRAASASPN
jgi:hypothetical protein